MYIATEEVGQLRNALVYMMCNISASFPRDAFYSEGAS